MRLREIRRYPVKAMGGESLATATLDVRGLVGDRAFAVVEEDGRFAAGKDTRRFRRRDRVFDYAARSDPGGIGVSRAASSWSLGPELDAELTASFGAPVRVLPEGAVSHFDAGPVSVVGTATLAAHGGVVSGVRRFRCNVLVETSEAYEEESWSLVRIGEVVLRCVGRAPRCRVVDLAQDGAPAARSMLKSLDARDLHLAIYAEVAEAGVIGVGDEVHVLD